ncbi:MAG: hypothetical protein KAS32_30315 [Candidatus Peribacteraceae bacterium]|nr:hypothetical protein [Candidatus Peribacteraceae bacterium]
MTDTDAMEFNSLRKQVRKELRDARAVQFPVWLEQSGFVQKAKNKKWSEKHTLTQMNKAFENAFWKECGLAQLDLEAWTEYFFEGPLSETYNFIQSLPKALKEYFKSIQESIGHKMEQLHTALGV